MIRYECPLCKRKWKQIPDVHGKCQGRPQQITIRFPGVNGGKEIAH